MTFYEALCGYDGDRWSLVFYRFKQPLWRYAAAWLYSKYALHDRWLRPFDRIRERRRKLPEDCTIVHDHEGEPEECFFFAISEERDMHYFDWQRRGRTEYVRVDVSEVPRKQVERGEKFFARMKGLGE